MPLSPNTRSRFRSAVALVPLALLGACLSTTESQDQVIYGSIAIRAIGSAGSTFVATPTATFFNSLVQDLPNSRVGAEVCGTYGYAEEIINPGDLAAGDSLPLRVAGQSAGAMYIPAGAPRVFTIPGAGTFNYRAGDTLLVTVPGASNGFPASEISHPLAEPVELLSVRVATVFADTTRVAWKPRVDPTASIILSLRYAVSIASEAAERQIICLVRDALGAYTVPPEFLGAYLASPAEHRSLTVTRWRTNFRTLSDRATLYIVSTIDTTVAIVR